MKIHIKFAKDTDIDENAISYFEMVTAARAGTFGLLPTDEIVVDASTVPVSFYKEWFYYKVNKYSKPTLQFSPKLYAKFNKKKS